MNLTSEQSDALIQIVRDVAAKEIRPLFRNLDVSDIDSKSAPDDLVTVADRAAELAITAAVRELLPNAAIVGEEAVSADKSILDRVGQGQVVVIDPIDGTWNFANGIATYGVILSVIEDGKIVFGLLYDPSYDDWIVATEGRGAWFCGANGKRRRLTLDTPPELSDCFGYVGMYLFAKPEQARIAAQLSAFRRTQSLRCACHEYRLLAGGASQFYLTGMLNVWDHAAGVLVYQEAGGVVRLLDGRDYHPTMREGRLLTAASEELWSELAKRFAFLA
ncbi:fructose-1,6-bisphosphatase/inositol monophosphatase family enzyme [Litoreibacter meonggei]|uniref:Fructose-1,6-bisphosphatase/inositol monophosphatase family enzyme n=1 Tax=Litoreibacter meonggei TaxID=1049199 RepID=A0A497WRD1_9RHOB|nr:inositol monophosphatase family protein [Litoreibacter meonggei]RLJ59381.1 fructose-1,6-bisphosphatase/inositol monophosphatase family enzyme [Litoreibacter meonggei]